MATRREFLTSLLGAGAMSLVAACGGGASQTPSSPTSSAVKPAATTAAAPAPPQAAPTQAAAAKPAAAGGTITMALENDVIDFDPMLSRAFVDRNAHYQIYDSLVRVDPTGKIIPWLADKWDTSADGKQVTFTLRTDVKYHDGSVFDAASVKWNIDRYRTTDASARKGELAPLPASTSWTPSTVRFNLTTPFSPLLSLLVDRAGMMVSQKVAEAAGQDFTRKAFKAGTGPFMLTEAVKDDHITLEKNPAWWGKDSAGNALPLLDKIIIKPITDSNVRLTNLKTGDAHIANNIAPKDVASVKTDSTLTYQEVPGLSFGSLVPNRKEGFTFNEARYVKAVSMALDRQELLDKAFFGIGVVGYGTIAPAHFAFDANFKPFAKADAEGAKALVQAVGKGPLAFEFLVPSGDPALLAAGAAHSGAAPQGRHRRPDRAARVRPDLEAAGRSRLQGHDVRRLERPRRSRRQHLRLQLHRPAEQRRELLQQGRRQTARRSAADDGRGKTQRRAAQSRADLRRRRPVARLVPLWRGADADQQEAAGLQPYPDQIPRFQFASLQK